MKRIRQRITGVYVLTIGPYVYVGESWDIGARWRQHRAKLVSGRHPKRELQAACDELGITSLRCGIVERCEQAGRRRQAEREWADLFADDPFLAIGLPYADALAAIGW